MNRSRKKGDDRSLYVYKCMYDGKYWGAAHNVCLCIILGGSI